MAKWQPTAAAGSAPEVAKRVAGKCLIVQDFDAYLRLQELWDLLAAKGATEAMDAALLFARDPVAHKADFEAALERVDPPAKGKTLHRLVLAVFDGARKRTAAEEAFA